MHLGTGRADRQDDQAGRDDETDEHPSHYYSASSHENPLWLAFVLVVRRSAARGLLLIS
jgi:hypothetical protein